MHHENRLIGLYLINQSINQSINQLLVTHHLLSVDVSHNRRRSCRDHRQSDWSNKQRSHPQTLDGRNRFICACFYTFKTAYRLIDGLDYYAYSSNRSNTIVMSSVNDIDYRNICNLQSLTVHRNAKSTIKNTNGHGDQKSILRQPIWYESMYLLTSAWLSFLWVSAGPSLQGNNGSDRASCMLQQSASMQCFSVFLKSCDFVTLDQFMKLNNWSQMETIL